MVLFVMAVTSIYFIESVMVGRFYFAIVSFVFILWGAQLLYSQREILRMNFVEYLLYERKVAKEEKLEWLRNNQRG